MDSTRATPAHVELERSHVHSARAARGPGRPIKTKVKSTPPPSGRRRPSTRIAIPGPRSCSWSPPSGRHPHRGSVTLATIRSVARRRSGSFTLPICTLDDHRIDPSRRRRNLRISVGSVFDPVVQLLIVVFDPDNRIIRCHRIRATVVLVENVVDPAEDAVLLDLWK
jgi:hypothetical protein